MRSSVTFLPVYHNISLKIRDAVLFPLCAFVHHVPGDGVTPGPAHFLGYGNPGYRGGIAGDLRVRPLDKAYALQIGESVRPSSLCLCFARLEILGEEAVRGIVFSISRLRVDLPNRLFGGLRREAPMLRTVLRWRGRHALLLTPARTLITTRTPAGGSDIPALRVVLSGIVGSSILVSNSQEVRRGEDSYHDEHGQ